MYDGGISIPCEKAAKGGAPADGVRVVGVGVFDGVTPVDEGLRFEQDEERERSGASWLFSSPLALLSLLMRLASSADTLTNGTSDAVGLALEHPPVSRRMSNGKCDNTVEGSVRAAAQFAMAPGPMVNRISLSKVVRCVESSTHPAK